MASRISHYLFVMIAYSFTTLATAQDDPDLELLPEVLKEDRTNTPEDEQPRGPSADSEPSTSLLSNVNLWVDDTFRLINRQDENDLIVSLPADDRPNWENFLRLNGRGNQRLGHSFEVSFETTLNVFGQDDHGFNTSDDLRLDVEEVYISWRGSPTSFLDVGRINIRYGVAGGFNPTDYFRVNSVVTRTTEDVSQLRDNRLGVLSGRYQKVWKGGSLTFVAAPDVGAKEDRWYTDHEVYGLHLNDTNDKTRFLVAFTHELINGFSPELLYFNESGHHNLGLNLTYALTDRTVLFTEWNIGKRRSLVGEALFESSRNIPLHPSLSQALSDTEESYLHQAVIGFAYTSDLDITTDVEYHFNEAGLTDSDWDTYFALGEAANDNPAIIGPLLSMRGLARDRIEPASRHELMLRTTWTDFIPDLSSTGLLIFDLVDSSYLAQLELTWNINPRASLTGQIARYEGSNDSNYGSLAQETTLSFQFNYYF